jgi:plastocyanin
MPKQTLNYKLGYFVAGEFTDPTTESNRWNTVDIQLRGLYEVLGNGVLNGWAILQSSQNALSIEIAPGTGVISFVSCVSTVASTIAVLPNQTNHIYATLTNDSYWTQSVAFSTFLTGGDRTDAVFIGTVITDETSITSIDITGRSNIGLFLSVSRLIAQHRHIGGEDSPQPIDLTSEVQGIINQENLPDLDTSIIKSGVLSPDVIPSIDHNTLVNKGSLTHSQLDSFAEILSNQNNNLMGTTILVNFLQLILALKHQWPEVDEYLVNELAFIPGISPNSIIDTANTTADVDTRTSQEGGQHTISGHPGPGTEIFTKTFNTEEELNKAEKSGVSVAGSSLILKTTEIRTLIEDFEDVSDWKTSIQDLSSNSGTFVRDAEIFIQGQYSGKVDINIDTQTNVAFVLEKHFSAQDWSKYNRIVFYLKTENVDHGDIYFYLDDATYGSQNSFTLVLEKNAPTINRDTLMVGWREISVDISKFQRQAITSIGYYTSTKGGWDASKPLSLNIDNIYLTRGNEFVDNGYARFIYGDESYKNFYKIRWDSLNPTGTTFKVRTRLANDLNQFNDSDPNHVVWSSYNFTSDFEISNPTGALYKYIQIETFFESDAINAFSPVLERLFLDTYLSSTESQFTYNTKENWESGTLVNADISSQPGKVLIDNIKEIGNFIYGLKNKVIKADENCNPILEIAGTALPITTNQVINGLTPSFGQISGLEKGNNNTFWIADTDNDRVVQIDNSGKLVYGLYGSWLNEPIDYYGTEERGPGSNIDYPTSKTENTYADKLAILHSFYNPNESKLSLIFNRPVAPLISGENSLDFSKIFLKSGSYRFYFDSNTPISLFGIDQDKYNSWIGSTNKFINQFNFDSHILQLSLSQADSATLSSVVDFSIPSIVVISPTQNSMVTEDYVTLSFLVSNITIGSDYQIRIKIDDGTYSYFETTSIFIEDLTEEYHEIEAAIVDENNNPLDNQESIANIEFIVDLSGSVNIPRITINNPKQNQTFSSSPIQIDFTVYNFPILPVGQHIRFSIDNGYWQAWRSTDPIVISNIASGYHYIDIYLADEYGIQISSPYSRTYVECYVGISSLAQLNVVLDANAIKAKANPVTTKTSSNATTTITEDVWNKECITNVDVGNLYASNIYAPIDIQYVANEISTLNSSGIDSILIAKLRSPSSLYSLPVQTSALITQTLQTTPPVDDLTIFDGNKYMDGHSVVQITANNGQLLFSQNAARFSDNRTNAKIMLGSARKIDSQRVIMGDSIRKRAIITNTNLNSHGSFVCWEYLSERYILDAQPIAMPQKEILVNESSVNPEEIIISSGITVIWTNNSLAATTIYSGYTTLEQFNADPDLTLYGDDFVSQELQPGEQFSFTFNNLGTFYWFAYPTIVTGIIYVSASGVSSTDQYLLVENDMSSSAFGSRIVKINSYGKIIWEFGTGYLCNPKDVRILPDESSIIVST